MSEIAIITDTHFGARGDSLPMQANQTKFLSNVFFPTLDKRHITTVVHLGDYVDRRKYVNYQTAGFIESQYRVPLRNRMVQEIVLLGNHDTFYKDTNLVNSVSELYRLDQSITVITGPEEMVLEGLPVLMLPWICDANREKSMQLIRSSSCAVVMGHLELGGFQMYRGMPNHEGLDSTLFDRFEMVLTGHYHHRSTRPPVHYLGAPWPMIWSDYQDERGFHIFNTDNKTLTYIENPYSLFHRVVYDDANQSIDYVQRLCAEIAEPDSPYRESYVKVVVKNKTQPYWFELMMEAIYKANPLDVIVVDDIVVNEDGTETASDSLDVDTLQLMREYVDSLSINCDRSELHGYLSKLYHEAITANQAARFA